MIKRVMILMMKCIYIKESMFETDSVRFPSKDRFSFLMMRIFLRFGWALLGELRWYNLI